VCTVQWDLGLQGLGMLLLISLGFGMFAQVMLARTTTRWAWLVATAAYFVAGLLISEVWFGWATAEELQPNIDGLSFDEVLLGLIPAIAIVLWIRHLTGRRRDESVKGTRAQPETHSSKAPSGLP
jgi:hypothetical protein